jgi:hypothetical protein
LKKHTAAALCMTLALFFSACSTQTNTTQAASETPASAAASSAIPAGPATNLTWKNSGIKAGPSDGPGYSVYSNVGFNKASAVVCLSQAKTNLSRKSDGKAINAYAFLGIDVYRNGTQWTNCMDAGLLRSGNDGKWHACSNRYMVDPDDNKWWESDVSLDETHDYKLVLDSSQKNEEVTLQVIDVTDGNKTVDSKTFQLYYTKADGSTTSYYSCISMAFPPDICKDTKGMDSDDYEEVLKYNTNEGLYFRNAILKDATLYNASGSMAWSASCTKDRFLWPTKSNTIEYPCITLTETKQDYEEIVNIDLNH